MTSAVYDEIADWYDDAVSAGRLLHDLVVPAVLELAGDVAGQRVCDLACGQGVVGRQLARRGARVVGIDLSARLLAIARQYEQADPLGIAYLCADAQGLAAVGDAAFDGVVCNLALMDIADLASTLGAVRRILRHGGWLVFSIVHPCFETPVSGWVDHADGGVTRQVGGYFAERFWRSDDAGGVRWRVGAYHRTLSTYVNCLSGAGLLVERLVEPRETRERARRVPGYGEVPVALVARCAAAPPG